DLDERFAVLLLDEGPQRHRLDLLFRFGHRGGPSLARRLLAPLGRSDTDVREEGMADLPFRLDEDQVRTFSGTYEIALRRGISQSIRDRSNEAVVEISPQSTVFDVGVHPGKWRRHKALLRKVLQSCPA